MRNFVLGILITVVLISVVGAVYFFSRPTTLPVNNPSPQPIQTNGPLVGNDLDAHGCKPSTGYSWCEAKQKCLRSWEESCTATDDTTLIKQALFTKNNWATDSGITVSVKTNDGKYASGTAGGQGGGGYFYAAKVAGVWKIVADGNGVILCSSLAAYPDFPKTLIPECWDQTNNKNVTR